MGGTHLAPALQRATKLPGLAVMETSFIRWVKGVSSSTPWPNAPTTTWGCWSALPTKSTAGAERAANTGSFEETILGSYRRRWCTSIGATMAAKSVKTTFVQKCFLILFFQYFERLRRRRWWKMAKFVQKVCAKTLSLISSLSWKVGNWGWGKWIG